MAWDDAKTDFETLSNVPAGEKLTASEWNTHTTDQQERGYDTVTTVTGAYTASYQEAVLVDASGGAVTVTLPAVRENGVVTVKKIDSSGNAVTVATPGSETIDGSSDLTISSQWGVSEVISDGTGYFVI